MTDTIDTKVVLDTKEAQRSARDYKGELVQLGKAEEFVAKAQGEIAKEAQKARDQLLSVRRQQIEGTGDATKLAERTKALNLRMAELREVSRSVTGEQKKLRDEQKRVRTEMGDSTRATQEQARALADLAKQTKVAEQASARLAVTQARASTERKRMLARQDAESARNVAATARAQARSESLGIRSRSLHSEDIASARRINELETSIAKLDRQLAGVGGQSMRSRFGYGLAGGFVGNDGPYKKKAGGGYVDDQGRGVELNKVMNEAAGRRGKQAIGGLPAVGGMAFGAGAALLGGGATAVSGIAGIGGEFERLRTSLETIEGSKGKAEATFEVIKKFAKDTPYELTEVTNAFIQLKTRGLDASEGALKAYGDTASAMGFKLEDMVQAVASAAFGEFEPLKKFGVSAKVDGDKVIATFDGVTTTIGRDAKSIEQYIQNIGETKFAGGMEKQSKTMTGQLSNLSDTVSQLADTAFTSGLGDALKDVIADMTNTIGTGDDLAKTIGETLGQAVRDTYAWVKDFIGPFDELPGKFQAAFATASEFVGGLGSVIGMGMDLIETIGAGNVAIGAFGLALTAATGPLGAVATAGFLAGQAIGKYVYEVTHAEERTMDLAASIAHFQSEVEHKLLQKQLKEFEAELDDHNQMAGRVGKAQDKVTSETLRRYGVADEIELPKEARQKLNAYRAKIGRDSIDSVEENLGAFSAAADRPEFERLKAKRKKGKLLPSEKKRLAALAGSLDETLPSEGKGKKTKEHVTEFEAERKQEIDKAVKQAEVEAADASLLAGQGGDAANAAAREAGKSTRKNLEEMAHKGVLPGDVERAALRAAGYDDVSNAPPPPIIVYDQKFYNTFTMPTTIEAKLSGDPATAAGEFAKQVQFVFETVIVPQAARGYATALKR